MTNAEVYTVRWMRRKVRERDYAGDRVSINVSNVNVTAPAGPIARAGEMKKVQHWHCARPGFATARRLRDKTKTKFPVWTAARVDEVHDKNTVMVGGARCNPSAPLHQKTQDGKERVNCGHFACIFFSTTRVAALLAALSFWHKEARATLCCCPLGHCSLPCPPRPFTLPKPDSSRGLPCGGSGVAESRMTPAPRMEGARSPDRALGIHAERGEFCARSLVASVSCLRHKPS